MTIDTAAVAYSVSVRRHSPVRADHGADADRRHRRHRPERRHAPVQSRRHPDRPHPQHRGQPDQQRHARFLDQRRHRGRRPSPSRARRTPRSQAPAPRPTSVQITVTKGTTPAPILEITTVQLHRSRRDDRHRRRRLAGDGQRHDQDLRNVHRHQPGLRRGGLHDPGQLRLLAQQPELHGRGTERLADQQWPAADLAGHLQHRHGHRQLDGLQHGQHGPSSRAAR